MSDAENQPELSLSALWACSRELAQAAVRSRDTDAALDEVIALETAILTGKITSWSDCIAVLRVIALSFGEGLRDDGADGQAIENVIAWLEMSDETPAG